VIVAHVGPVPLEEMLPLFPALGAFLALARGWVMLRLRGRGHGPTTRPTSRMTAAGSTAWRSSSQTRARVKRP
jgi:hypothetical protein